MANYELIFDLGSAYTSAALVQDGFVDKIPSVVVYGGDDRVTAVGVDAIRMTASLNSGLKLTYPIVNGSIVDAVGAKAIVSTLLDRLVCIKISAFTRYNVTCIVPCGTISNDKKTIEAMFLGLGAKRVSFVETPVSAAMQLFGEFRSRNGVIADLGYNCADLAVVSGNEIIAGCTLYHGGKDLTQAIADKISNKYVLQIPYEQAEYLKLNCASLYPNDATVVSVSGVNSERGVNEKVNISSKELYDTVVGFSRIYSQIIKSLLASVPSELALTLKNDGVMLCGGGAKLAGLDMFLQGELGIPVRISKCPEEAAINGQLQSMK